MIYERKTKELKTFYRMTNEVERQQQPFIM